MDYTKYNFQTRTDSSTKVNEALRQYMLKVYNFMSLALAITGLVAYFASTSEAFISTIYHVQNGVVTGASGMGYLLMFAPLAFVMVLSFGIQKLAYSTAQMIFWSYAAVMGLSLTSIFLVYTGESIARAFFITASVFGAMSLYGYTTKKDLTSWGSFLMMGVFGLIIASIVNIFLLSSAMQFAVSILGVIIFTGLTAYDTQNIKNNFYQVGGTNEELIGKAALMGALQLYLDFINIFMQMLYLFGDRKN
jgi:FtsH-binding integral membrane protein